jgi:hypothetical protein
MKRALLSWIGAICVVAPIAAAADDLLAPQPDAALRQSKIVKPPAKQGQSLGDVHFSDPSAPPVGAGKATRPNFPTAERATPVDPKGGMSFTYKWHATNEPFDPYWQLRNNEYGPNGPGNTFMGGLKLGF